MSGAEKKVAVALVVVLVAGIGLYIVTGNRAQSAPASPMAAAMPGGAPGGAGASAAGCAPTGAGGQQSAPTEELGKAGAKLEIVAVVPVAHGCHATTVAELKKAYQAHPDEIHLTVVDAWGPDAKKCQDKVGGITWTVIAINGNSNFELNGRKLQLQRQEGGSYSPTDLVPIIEAELKKPVKAS